MNDEILKAAAEFLAKHPDECELTSDLGEVHSLVSDIFCYTNDLHHRCMGVVHVERSIITIREPYTDEQVLALLKSVS